MMTHLHTSSGCLVAAVQITEVHLQGRSNLSDPSWFTPLWYRPPEEVGSLYRDGGKLRFNGGGVLVTTVVGDWIIFGPNGVLTWCAGSSFPLWHAPLEHNAGSVSSALPDTEWDEAAALEAITNQLSRACTEYMENSGDPLALACRLREQADVLWEQSILSQAKELAPFCDYGTRLYLTCSDKKYEIRVEEQGVQCRRTYPLKKGDGIEYTRKTGELISARVTEIKYFPEDTGPYQGQPWYVLDLKPEDLAKIGHRVTLPHARAILIWPSPADASEVGVAEGQTLGGQE